MRRLAPLAAVLLLAACAADGAPRGGGATITGGPALSADVFPFETPAMTFATRQGGIVGVRVEPTGDGALMWITGDFPQPRRIEWRRQGDDLVAHDGPDRGVVLLRFGAEPGTAWTSSGQTITFEGWERVETAVGTFDAARLRTEAGVDDLLVVESWWFARDAGLVRYAQDRAGLFRLEMSRVR